ncbi:uncharacterized protein P884DRAFT_288070 [Thermothelomyces heterothallicus CBS 202.75]|uniref:uncharacterized protein n=1 Tax=Thermothelomyces heterothallicus CBS 202.75 TaxID=1149848 RepID=UPI003743BFE7
MPLAQPPKVSSDPEIPPARPGRPRFHHRCTEDRIREGSRTPPCFFMAGKITRERKSIFRELGLDTDLPSQRTRSVTSRKFGEPTELAPASPASTHAVDEGTRNEEDGAENEAEGRPTQQEQGSSNRAESRSNPASPSETQRPWYSRLPRVRRPRIKSVSSSAPPSRMSTITRFSSIVLLIAARQVLERRNSPTDVCKRWAHQGE